MDTASEPSGRTLDHANEPHTEPMSLDRADAPARGLGACWRSHSARSLRRARLPPSAEVLSTALA